MVVISKFINNKKVYIIDVSWPMWIRKKLKKWLSAELNLMWGVNTKIMVGGLGTVTNNIGDYLSTIPKVPVPENMPAWFHKNTQCLKTLPTTPCPRKHRSTHETVFRQARTRDLLEK